MEQLAELIRVVESVLDVEMLSLEIEWGGECPDEVVYQLVHSTAERVSVDAVDTEVDSGLVENTELSQHDTGVLHVNTTLRADTGLRRFLIWYSLCYGSLAGRTL